MQHFRADTTILLKKLSYFFAPENMKKQPQKLLIIGPQFLFQYCQPSQNQPKSHILFHKNVSLRDFYINDFAGKCSFRKGFNQLRKNTRTVESDRLPNVDRVMETNGHVYTPNLVPDTKE